MKKIVIYLSAILFSCVIASCTKTDSDGKGTYHEYFIDEYLIPKDMMVATSNGTNGNVVMKFEGETLQAGDGRFEVLAQKNNDNYKRKMSAFPIRKVFAESLNNVKVITQQEFGSRYSAGSDISSLIQCRYESYYKYVQSGFTDGSWIETVECTAKGINASNTHLMKPDDIEFSFLQKPATPGTYTFDLIFTFENSEVKGRITCEFKEQ